MVTPACYCSGFVQEWNKRHLHATPVNSAVVAVSSYPGFHADAGFVIKLADVISRLFYLINLLKKPGYLSQYSNELQTELLRNRDSVPGRKRDFSFFHNVQAGSGAHPAFYSMCAGGSFRGG
jgi:hypothetical protein